MQITRRDFLKLAGASATILGLDASQPSRLEKVLAASTSPPVIWLQGALCTGCSVSLLNLTDPGVDDVVLNAVSLRYHPTVQAASGDLAVSGLLEDVGAYDGEFILVVEGAVPTAFDGRTCIIGERDGLAWTALDAVKELGAKAKYVVATGTCAAFGGIPARSAYTQSKTVAAVLEGTTRNPVVNLPGCPAHPNTIVATLVALLTTGVPELGAYSQPKSYYSATVHARCPRLYSPLTQIGRSGCYFLKGCKGPWAVIDCPVHKWNNGVSWCIQANTACIGCASPDFPAAQLMTYGRANARVDWRAHSARFVPPAPKPATPPPTTPATTTPTTPAPTPTHWMGPFGGWM